MIVTNGKLAFRFNNANMHIIKQPPTPQRGMHCTLGVAASLFAPLRGLIRSLCQFVLRQMWFRKPEPFWEYSIWAGEHEYLNWISISDIFRKLRLKNRSLSRVHQDKEVRLNILKLILPCLIKVNMWAYLGILSHLRPCRDITIN